MEDVSRQLKKGVLDILLLRLLAQGQMYGYELMTELNRRTDGFFAAKEGTLYPVLYRLEDAGHVESRWEQDTARRGVPRKYYAITPAGSQHLRLAAQELAGLIRGIQSIMGEELSDG